MPCSHLKVRFHINIEKHQEKSSVKVKYTFTTLSKKERKKQARKSAHEETCSAGLSTCSRAPTWYLCYPNLPKTWWNKRPEQSLGVVTVSSLLGTAGDR